jgi:hypothetical protein
MTDQVIVCLPALQVRSALDVIERVETGGNTDKK